MKKLIILLAIFSLLACDGIGKTTSSCDGTTPPISPEILGVHSRFVVNDFSNEDLPYWNLTAYSNELDLTLSYNKSEVAVAIYVSTKASSSMSKLPFRFSLFPEAVACSYAPPNLESEIMSIEISTIFDIDGHFSAGEEVTSLFSVAASRKRSEAIPLSEWNELPAGGYSSPRDEVFVTALLELDSSQKMPDGNYQFRLIATLENGLQFMWLFRRFADHVRAS